MGFEKLTLPGDLKSNSPAQKYQEEAKKRAQEEEIENPDRRKLLKYGALVGLGFALGVNTFKGKKDSSGEKEQTEFEKQLEAMKEDLKFIKEKLAEPLEKSGISEIYYEQLSSSMDDWEGEINSLMEQLKTEESEAALSVLLSRFEEMGKNVSIERLRLESKFAI